VKTRKVIMNSPQDGPSPQAGRPYVARVLEASVAGALIATFLSLYALVVYAVAGALHLPDGSKLALSTLVRGYFVACIAAGSIVGLLNPVFKAGTWGRRVVGGFAGAVAVPLFVLPLFHGPVTLLVIMAVIGAAAGAWMTEDDTTLEQMAAYRRWLRQRGLKEPK
jgi:hypothetical protein